MCVCVCPLLRIINNAVSRQPYIYVSLDVLPNVTCKTIIAVRSPVVIDRNNIEDINAFYHHLNLMTSTAGP